MNQQQLVQMQADFAGFQAQLAAANALATQAQAAAQQAQADNVVQATLIAQQQIDLTAAQALAAQAVVDAAAAQAAAAVAGVVQVDAVPMPPAGAPPIIAVNAPGQIMGVITFDTAGMKLHKSASAPLKDTFDGKSSKLTAFINDVGTRARSFGWDQAIFTIVTATGQKNMLDNDSSITMDDIRAMADNWVRKPRLVGHKLQRKFI
jgi:multidrug efflux pump subunit AcrA (membrane-fusion protein)